MGVRGHTDWMAMSTGGIDVQAAKESLHCALIDLGHSWVSESSPTSKTRVDAPKLHGDGPASAPQRFRAAVIRPALATPKVKAWR